MEIMVRKIQEFINKNRANLILYILALMLHRCSSPVQQKDDEVKLSGQDSSAISKEPNTVDTGLMYRTTKLSLGKDSLCLNLDLSVNDSIELINGESMRKAFQNLHNVWGQNDRIYFINTDSTQYISFLTNYGGYTGEYQSVEIGYVEGNPKLFLPNGVKNSDFNPERSEFLPKFYFTPCKYNGFVSGFGIKPGMSRNDFLNIIKSKKWKIGSLTELGIVIYHYKNEYCLYEAKYYFRKNKLVRFLYGYITP